MTPSMQAHQPIRLAQPDTIHISHISAKYKKRRGKRHSSLSRHAITQRSAHSQTLISANDTIETRVDTFRAGDGISSQVTVETSSKPACWAAQGLIFQGALFQGNFQPKILANLIQSKNPNKEIHKPKSKRVRAPSSTIQPSSSTTSAQSNNKAPPEIP